MLNGISVGHFGFFKDADLTMRVSSENLYDQIDADGWITVWFGGRNIFIPGYGTFNVHLVCGQSFFWDIVDENGVRTKDGFDQMLIPYNQNMEPAYGDLVPVTPGETFTNESPVPRTICANLWFYTNIFKDEYFRYYLIVANRNNGSNWLDEQFLRAVPMNENIHLNSGDIIIGYRPKLEYMNQLAVMKKITSGVDNSIMFKFKIDLGYISENPTAVRKIKIFTLDDDKSEFLVYPKKETDIIWDTHNIPFMSEYHRYLLYHGIQEYDATSSQLESAKKLYDSFMEVSNRILPMDEYNLEKVASDIGRVISGEDVYFVGYSRLIIPTFMEWFHENSAEDIPKGAQNILRRVVLTTKYFKGFYKLDEYLGTFVGNSNYLNGPPGVYDGDIDFIDGSNIIANGGQNAPSAIDSPDIGIIEVDGVHQFENGFVPSSAKGYRYPESTSDYKYSGDTGNGLYKIKIAEQIVDVFCDMVESEPGDAGWMYLIIDGNNMDYIRNFSDTSQIDSTIYSDDTLGLGWGKNDGVFKSLQFYNMEFSDVKVKLSGEYNNPVDGTGYLEIYTGANGGIIYFIDDDASGNVGQRILVDNEEVVPNSKTDLVNFDVLYSGDNDSINNLVLKMRGDNNTPYCRRYVKMLAVK